MKTPLMLLTLAALLLSRCRSYIGQRCFDRAEYSAYCQPADISAESGRRVLSDGENYYILLPRRRKMPCALNFVSGMGSKFCRPARNETVPGEQDLYRLSPELARYVIGRSTAQPSQIEEKISLAENPSELIARCRESFPIVNSPDKTISYQPTCYRKVTSPNASIHRALGYTSSVLLDVPITIAQNTAFVAAGIVGFAGSAIAAPLLIPLQQCRPASASKTHTME